MRACSCGSAGLLVTMAGTSMWLPGLKRCRLPEGLMTPWMNTAM